MIPFPPRGLRASFVKQRQIVARMERSAIRVSLDTTAQLPDFTSFHPGYEVRTKEKRKRNAGRRTVVSPAPAGAVAPRIKSACADPSAVGRARPPAVPHGSCPREDL